MRSSIFSEPELDETVLVVPQQFVVESLRHPRVFAEVEDHRQHEQDIFGCVEGIFAGTE